MERMFSSLFSSQMDTKPPVARALVKIITLLGTDTLNKSVKDHLIKVMRENPNIDKKEEVMNYIYALDNDEFAKTAAEKKDRINQVPTSDVTVGCSGATSQTNVSKLSYNSDKEEETKETEKEKKDQSPDQFPDVENQDIGTEEKMTDRNQTPGE